VADVERERAALGALVDEAAEPGDDPVASGLERIGSTLSDAAAALQRARDATGATERTTELARVRESAERAAAGARRVESLVGRGRQGSLEGRVTRATELLERLARRLDREIAPAMEPLAVEEREGIERKLERLARRREALGPVNPLAEQEYSEALEHVGRLEEQRHDLELALGELDGLITDTD